MMLAASLYASEGMMFCTGCAGLFPRRHRTLPLAAVLLQHALSPRSRWIRVGELGMLCWRQRRAASSRPRPAAMPGSPAQSTVRSPVVALRGLAPPCRRLVGTRAPQNPTRAVVASSVGDAAAEIGSSWKLVPCCRRRAARWRSPMTRSRSRLGEPDLRVQST